MISHARFNDYDGFVEKFKPKKCTDDCYTPDYIYDIVTDWVEESFPHVAGYDIIRPFWPGADYKSFDYGENSLVLDNPPFSIVSQIVEFYLKNGVKFFLFCPAVTLVGKKVIDKVTSIVTNIQLVYENGAKILTSFVTNISPEHRIILAGDLHKRLKDAQESRKAKTPLGSVKLRYPDNLVTAATLGCIVSKGYCLKIRGADCISVRTLDNSRRIFGAGFFISDEAAAKIGVARRMADEIKAHNAMAAKVEAYRNAETISLSPREIQLIKSLGNIKNQ